MNKVNKMCSIFDIIFYMIGNQIKYYRELYKYTQTELAQKLGISFQALSNYENNRREPNIALIKKICNIFEISTDELLEYNTIIKK